MFPRQYYYRTDGPGRMIRFLIFLFMIVISFLALSNYSILIVDAFVPSYYVPQHSYLNYGIIIPSNTYSIDRRLEVSLSATIFGKKPDSNSENTMNNNDNNDRNNQVTLLWTREQLADYANEQGIVVSLTTLGPAYRAIARSKHNTTQVLGYIEGFVRPGNQILHLDKMQVFKKMVRLARKENPTEFRGGGTQLGVGLLLGYICLLHGQSVGCTTAEFLAIDDEAYQHKRLVKYYKQGGFDIIKYVGDDWKSIPDRLMWGGCGTLLRKDIPYLLQFWTSLLEKSVRYKKSRDDDYIKLMQQKL